MTLVETLVMLAISAGVAMIVIPATSEGLRDNFRLADRAARVGEDAFSESDYRRLLRQAAPPLARPDGTVPDAGLEGGPSFLRFPVESDSAPGCPGGAGYAVVRLRVEQDGAGGRLRCDAAGASATMLVWDSGTLGFAYSADGRTWIERWPPAPRRRLGAPESEKDDGPPFIRMTLRDGSRTRLVWVEKAGDPALRPPPAPDSERARRSRFGGRL